MQNVLGTCAVLALLTGGLSLTGDLGWLLGRGMHVIQATDVPSAAPPTAVPAPPAVTTPGAVTPPARAAAAASTPLPPAADRRLPPSGGPETVDVSMLAPGTRIVVWLGLPGTSAADAPRPIALDVVDPVAREALMSEPQWPAQGRSAVAPSPPRRVLIRGSGPAGTIVRGGSVDMEPQGIAGTTGRETVGPVVALDVRP